MQPLDTYRVKGGFETKAKIIQIGYELAGDNFADDYDDETLKKLVEVTVETLFQEHYQLQQQWEYPTDCDKLDAVFQSLEATGLIPRQNYWCCQNCGSDAIYEELQSQPEKRGYVFYHEQDTEHAAEAGYLYLAYGAANGDEKLSLAIGIEVAQTLIDAGFWVSWSKTLEERIGIFELDWKRRR